MDLSLTLLLLVSLIIFFSAIAHGIIGFAFPLIATPLVALLIDIKIAVALTIIPNLIINLISAFKGKMDINLFKTFWPISLYIILGTIVGTQALLYLPQDLLKLILIGIIVLYLLQDRFKQLSLINTLAHKPYARGLFSLIGGFFSGSVNTGSVPLLLYFMSIQFQPLFMTQVLNASFAGSKVIQFITLELAGGFGTIRGELILFLSLISLLGVLIGFKVHSRVPVAMYFRLLRAFLATIGFLLLFQIIWHRVV